MRTTLIIDDDVLQVARELATAERRTTGEVISEVFRRGLVASSRPDAVDTALAALGLRPFRGGSVVTDAQVRELRQGLGLLGL
jgi:hypothetical protein